MSSGLFTESENLITTMSASHPLSVQLELGIHGRGIGRGFNRDPVSPLLSSVYLQGEEVALEYLEKGDGN